MWTLALECIWLTPLVLTGARPAVVVISGIAALVTANLVWSVLVREHVRR
jgi:hypothetical protein